MCGEPSVLQDEPESASERAVLNAVPRNKRNTRLQHSHRSNVVTLDAAIRGRESGAFTHR